MFWEIRTDIGEGARVTLADVADFCALHRLELSSMEVSMIFEIQRTLIFDVSKGASLPKLTMDVLDSQILPGEK